MIEMDANKRLEKKAVNINEGGDIYVGRIYRWSKNSTSQARY